MAFQAGDQQGGPKSDINVTPLVDVVLVLLIIFMVVTPLLQVGFDADIPKTQEELKIDMPTQADQVVVSIKQDGTLVLNKDAVTEEELRAKLGEIMKNKKPEKRIAFLSGTDNLEFGRVIRIMDLCTGAGVKRIGIIDPL